jgi:hypothetical protein
MSDQTALVTVDNASLDEPLLLHVRLSSRILRALSLLADLQDFYGDGHFDIVSEPESSEDRPLDDAALLGFVLNSAADETNAASFARFIDTSLFARDFIVFASW